MGCPVGAGDGSACAQDGGAIGVEGVLEVLVIAVGDRVGVWVLGACALGDGFACGGEAFGEGELWEGVVGFGSCGVERCGVEALWEVVYWACVVVLPIGLSCPVKFGVCRRGDRDTRWVFYFSRGVGVGRLKWQTSGFPSRRGGNLQEQGY
jgi:hypothetical protein